MLSSAARFETPNASKYLQALCKHFQHKITVEYDDKDAKAELPPGPAVLHADESGLDINVTAEDAEGLVVAKHIVEAHLLRFAFREEPEALAWTE